LIYLAAAVAVCLAMVGGVRSSLLHVTVRGTSMLPTLRPDDRVLVLRWPARWLRRGQIVLLRGYFGGAPRHLVVKRVRGLAGDIVEPARPLRVPAGKVYVGGDSEVSTVDRSVEGRNVVGVVVWRYRSKA
jgi:signal peptidase I